MLVRVILQGVLIGAGLFYLGYNDTSMWQWWFGVFGVNLLLSFLFTWLEGRFKCLIGRHEWILLSVFGKNNIVRSTYFCKNCMKSHITERLPVITGTTTITEALIIGDIINKQTQPHWIDDLSHKVEKALEKNP